MKASIFKLITSLLIVGLTTAMPINEGIDTLGQRTNLNHGSKRNAKLEPLPLAEPPKARDIEATADDQTGPHSHGEGWP